MSRDLQYPIVGNIVLRGFLRDIREGRPLNAQMATHAALEPIISNDMLRDALWEFLQADYNYLVEYHRAWLKPKNWITKKLLTEPKFVTPNQLEELDHVRDQALKAFEMLRRLICYDNLSLAVKPTLLPQIFHD